MSFFQSLISAVGNAYATVMIIGDSVARGNSDAVGPTPTTDTVYQWDDGAGNVRMITNTDLLEPVAAGSPGSEWPQFGITFNSLTGRKPLMINCAIGGGGWYRPNATYSWYTNGTLWSDAVTKTNNCLSFIGKQAPDCVFINMGINESIVDSYTLDIVYLTDLIDKINTEYSSPRIFVAMPGKTSVTTYTLFSRVMTIRKFLKTIQDTYSNVEVCGDLNTLMIWGGNFQVDEFHLTGAGNNLFGERIARQMALSMSYHKYARTLIGLMYDDLSVTKKGYINDFIIDLVGAGLLTEIDELHILSDAGGDDRNANVPWCLLSPCSFAGSPTISNLYTDVNGSSQYVSIGVRTVFAQKTNITNDYITGAFIADNASAAGGSNRYLIGVRETATGGLVGIAQFSDSTIRFFGSTGSSTSYATDTAFSDNSHYAVARDGGDEVGFKNGVEVIRAANAYFAITPTSLRGYGAGAINTNGTIANYLDVQIKATYTAKYSTWDIAAFETIMNDFLALWQA